MSRVPRSSSIWFRQGSWRGISRMSTARDQSLRRRLSVSGNAIAVGHSQFRAWRSPHLFRRERRFPAMNRVPLQPAEGWQQRRDTYRRKTSHQCDRHDVPQRPAIEQAGSVHHMQTVINPSVRTIELVELNHLGERRREIQPGLIFVVVAHAQHRQHVRRLVPAQFE